MGDLEEKVSKARSEPMIVGKIARKLVLPMMLIGGAYIGGMATETAYQPGRTMLNEYETFRKPVSPGSYDEGENLRVRPQVNENEEVQWYLVNIKDGEKKLIDERGLVPGDVYDRFQDNLEGLKNKGKDLYEQAGKHLKDIDKNEVETKSKEMLKDTYQKLKEQVRSLKEYMSDIHSSNH